jgi:hypothetical protein
MHITKFAYKQLCAMWAKINVNISKNILTKVQNDDTIVYGGGNS